MVTLGAAMALYLASGSLGGELEPLQGKEFVFEVAPFSQCHASTLLELKDGSILAAWFGGTEEGHSDVGIWIARRTAGGDPAIPRWSPPKSIAREPGVPCWNPVLFHDAEGRLWLFYKVGPSPERWSGAYKISENEGETFGPAELLPAGILGPIKNKPLLLPSGDVLCGSSVESYRAWTCWIEQLSRDGKTWQKFGPITVPGHPHGIIQPALYRGDLSGEIYMLTRSRGIGKICRARSTDLGKSWSPASPIDLPHPNSGIDCVRLRDGPVLLVYNHTSRGRTPLNIALSSDMGKSWKPAAVLETEPGEYSYPAVIQLSTGDVAVTYTWKRRRIRFAQIPLSQLVR